MKAAEDPSQGQKLLTAVERIISDTDSLIELAQKHLQQAQKQRLSSESETRAAAAAEVVSHFSNRAAISGGWRRPPR